MQAREKKSENWNLHLRQTWKIIAIYVEEQLNHFCRFFSSYEIMLLTRLHFHFRKIDFFFMLNTSFCDWNATKSETKWKIYEKIRFFFRRYDLQLFIECRLCVVVQLHPFYDHLVGGFFYGSSQTPSIILRKNK